MSFFGGVQELDIGAYILDIGAYVDDIVLGLALQLPWPRVGCSV